MYNILKLSTVDIVSHYCIARFTVCKKEEEENLSGGKKSLFFFFSPLSHVMPKMIIWIIKVYVLYIQSTFFFSPKRRLGCMQARLINSLCEQRITSFLEIKSRLAENRTWHGLYSDLPEVTLSDVLTSLTYFQE